MCRMRTVNELPVPGSMHAIMDIVHCSEQQGGKGSWLNELVVGLVQEHTRTGESQLCTHAARQAELSR